MIEPFDCVIRGGRVVSAGGTFDGDVAIAQGRIAAMGRGLGPACREIDAAAAWCCRAASTPIATSSK